MSVRTLSVQSDLALTHGGHSVRVRADGDLLVVDVPLRLCSVRPSRAWIGTIDRALDYTGLTARIRVAGIPLFQLGRRRFVPFFLKATGLSPE